MVYPILIQFALEVLRNQYSSRFFEMLRVFGTETAIADWLGERNPRLQNRTPAEVIFSGEVASVLVAFSVRPAENMAKEER